MIDFDSELSEMVADKNLMNSNKCLKREEKIRFL